MGVEMCITNLNPTGWIIFKIKNNHQQTKMAAAKDGGLGGSYKHENLICFQPRNKAWKYSQGVQGHPVKNILATCNVF